MADKKKKKRRKFLKIGLGVVGIAAGAFGAGAIGAGLAKAAQKKAQLKQLKNAVDVKKVFSIKGGDKKETPSDTVASAAEMPIATSGFKIPPIAIIAIAGAVVLLFVLKK